MPRAGSTGYREIAAQLRRGWLAAWQPGQRLPTYEQLQSQLGTTRATLQRAMDLLADQGFIQTRPTVGTYLAERPPNETTVGLVFPGHPEARIRSWQWTRHFQAIAQAVAAGDATDAATRIRVYHDVGGSQSDGFLRLWRDVEDDVLAGLLFPFVPHQLDDTALIRQPPLPLVFLNGAYTQARLAVHYDKDALIAQAAELLAACGRRRPALLTIPERRGTDLGRLFETGSGLRLPPERIQAASPYHPHWLPNLLKLLLQPGPDGRPDALLVADDHLVEPVAAALVDMGIRLGDDLMLVGHWNFPLAYRGPQPVTLIGFGAQAWVRQAVALALAARRGEVLPPQCIPIPLHVAGAPAPAAVF